MSRRDMEESDGGRKKSEVEADTVFGGGGVAAALRAAAWRMEA